MKMTRLIPVFLILFSFNVVSQDLDSLLPVRAFAIGAPGPDGVEKFVEFIDKELGPNYINTLILRVDYNYAFESYPNLRDEDPLTKAHIKQIVASARRHNIRLIPQINLLGHQSWAGSLGNLLVEYPQFDETPHVAMPDNYEWPNDDGLYCKSYCPLHPEVHEVVFAVMDEIVEVFETDAFHAGMDEVFYIGDEKCPRCAGKKTSELFAGEVTKIRDHLAANNHELWIWGDRLIDGNETGLGMWEASQNGTQDAIDMIPKDVIINDWHYNRAEPLPPYFALKGLKIISCTWNKPEVTTKHIDQMLLYRKQSNEALAGKMYGVMQTVWSDAGGYLNRYYNPESVDDDSAGDVKSFKAMIAYLNELADAQGDD